MREADYSLAACEEYWKHAVERGRVDKSTARIARRAVVDVVRTLPIAQWSDLRGIDIEQAIGLYKDHNADRLRPGTLSMYGSHARRGLGEFLADAAHPAAGLVEGRSERPTAFTIALLSGHEVTISGLPDHLAVGDAEKVIKTVSVHIDDDDPAVLDLLRQCMNASEADARIIAAADNTEQGWDYSLEACLAYWQERTAEGAIHETTRRRIETLLVPFVRSHSPTWQSDLRRIDITRVPALCRQMAGFDRLQPNTMSSYASMIVRAMREFLEHEQASQETAQSFTVTTSAGGEVMVSGLPCNLTPAEAATIMKRIVAYVPNEEQGELRSRMESTYDPDRWMNKEFWECLDIDDDA